MSALPYRDSGPLRHPVTLLSRTAGFGASGDHVYTTSESTIWCDIRMQSAAEAFRFLKPFPTATHLFITRHHPSVAITPKDALSFSSRTFEINSVQTYGERDQWVAIVATENS